MVLDNTTAIAYINKGGGTRSIALTTIAKSLVKFCEERSLTVEACHLAGARNVIADAESRATLDASDWKLDSIVASRVFALWPCDVDRFSSAWNAQLKSFVSWRP